MVELYILIGLLNGDFLTINIFTRRIIPINIVPWYINSKVGL